ncbi:MAG TPA: hypothetical protein VMS86_16050 [Thermoanaerobaculia bacterium]|nr:hypothetical protein [Thermoanaerobaculia bacterium]
MTGTDGRRIAIGAGALVLFCALTWWLLDFRPAYAGSRLPSDLGDPVLVLYFLEWGGKSLARGVRGYLEFWDANFYFPERGVMTFSDHVLGPAVQMRAFKLLWDNGVAGYNFLFLGSFVLSGLTAAWVVRQAGASRWAATLAGVMFAFSPYRFDQRAHLQVLLAQWIPLVLWLWHRLLEEPVARRAVPFLAVYLLHVTGGMYLAYFVHFALALLLLQHLDRWRSLAAPRARRVLLPTLGACAAAAALVFGPYVVASDRLGLGRSMAEYGLYGATLLSYLSAGVRNEVWGDLLEPLARPENQLFAGLVTTVLAAIGIRRLWVRPRTPLFRAGGQAVRKLDPDRPARMLGERERILLGALAIVAAAGILLGDVATLAIAQEIAPGSVPDWLAGHVPAMVLLGAGGMAWTFLSRRWRGAWPFLPPAASRWDRGMFVVGLAFLLLSLPVVFAPLARVVPGLDGLRVPARVYPFVSFALAYFAARGLDGVSKRAAGWRRHVLLAVVSLVLVWELRDTMIWHPWPSRGEIPAIFHRIAEVPDVGAVLHLPIPSAAFEAHYMYYSTAHWRPIANGYSGYEPATHVEVRRRVENELFEPSTLDYLWELGITHVSVHPWLFRMPVERRRLLRWERRFSDGADARLRPLLLVERDRLYELLPPRGSDGPQARTSLVANAAP